MQCETVSLQLAEFVDGDSNLSLETGRHVEACLRCQAELAQYRKLLRALTMLRDQYVTTDASILDELLDALRPVASVHRIHRLHHRNKKAAYVGGIAAAATATAAAGAFVIASRLAGRQRLAG